MNLDGATVAIRSVLVIDWPSREVPESLARAGLRVFVRGGSGPQDFSEYRWQDGAVAVHPLGRAPDGVDLVYSYRPLSELPAIVALARELGARVVWTQSGKSAAGAADPKGCWLSAEDLAHARQTVEAAGMRHVSAPYIADLAGEL